MNAINYPFDPNFLLRKKRTIKKELLSNNAFTNIKVAVLCGSTANEIVDQLDIFLLSFGIKADFYISEYNKYWEDAIFANDKLIDFRPDIVYIHTNWRNILFHPASTDDEQSVDQKLDNEFGRLQQMWMALHSRFKCLIIQNNFDKPLYRLYGNLDISDYRGFSNYLFRLNYKIYEFKKNNEYFYINDIDYLSSDVGLSNWNDLTAWHLYKYAIGLNAIPTLSFNVAKIIKSIYGKNKKVLVLDLDNTLWGGIIGDDGVNGISIGNDNPQGEVFYDFQKYCKELKNIGVILGVNSKNEKSNALLGLSHPSSILKEEDFVSIKANWEPKNVNMTNMASELNLGIDSFVFIDDNPAEREIIKNFLPTVSVLESSDPERFPYLLDRAGFFEPTVITSEDRKKTDLYKSMAKAAELLNSFDKYEDYLTSLSMKATIKDFEPIHYSRLSQLSNKSNQFNLTTLRCTEENIRHYSESDNYITKYATLTDKFSDNGLVAEIIGEIVGSDVHIRLLLMSCRVLKRGLEDALMNTFIENAANLGLDRVFGYYYSSSKNNMVKDFYLEYGFNIIEKQDSEIVFELNIKDYNYRKVYMDVEK